MLSTQLYSIFCIFKVKSDEIYEILPFFLVCLRSEHKYKLYLHTEHARTTCTRMLSLRVRNKYESQEKGMHSSCCT